ncbi:LpxL/LpxP family acyltransferase [Iodobacter ciconiae]|uniref:LpxL/LpxP family acyltransferase n=1 Tax=Iodobacter ciconiae TaxID=2496266 RepID=UPI0019CFEA0B|nr:acyltransferase [Iodobacter ciconiae]
MSPSPQNTAKPPPQHWAEIGEKTFITGIWLLFWVHKLLGRWPFRLCLYPVIAAQWLSRPALRHASMQYLQRLEAATGALGHTPSWQDSLKHLALFAETILDKLLAVSGRYHFSNVRTEGRETFYATAEQGLGGIIITAHLGCLELCRAMAEDTGKIRLNILVHTQHARRFNQLLKQLNPGNDLQLIEVSEVGPATAVLLSEKITAGEYIVIAGDRIPVFASQTVQADFLGHSAPFPAGPYILASLLKCPLYLLGCIHEGHGYNIHFETLASSVILPRKQRNEAMAGYAAQYAQALTALLKRSPYDWFNFFAFWDQTRDKH